MLVQITNRHRKTLVDAMIRNAHRRAKQLYRSLTWDRDSELAMHRHFTLAADIQIHFRDPDNVV